MSTKDLNLASFFRQATSGRRFHLSMDAQTASLVIGSSVQRIQCGGSGQRLTLTVRQGTVWMTRLGDQRDFILRSGESITVEGPADLLLQAFAPRATCGREGATAAVEVAGEDGIPDAMPSVAVHRHTIPPPSLLHRTPAVHQLASALASSHPHL